MLPARSPTVMVRRRTGGHQHLMNRRSFLASGAGALGGLAGAQLVGAGPAYAAHGSEQPRPIPGGIQPFGPGSEVFHTFLPGTGEPSTITDFNGFAGVAEIQGRGAGANSGLTFDVDNRFYAGEYVALDGTHHHATFGFL